jgi:hypothetical protein
MAKRKDPFDTLQKRCIQCHDESYGELANEWKSTSDDLLKKTFTKMQQVREQIRKIERDGGHTFVYRKLYGDAGSTLTLQAETEFTIRNIPGLLEHANKRLDDAIKLWLEKGEVSKSKCNSIHEEGPTPVALLSEITDERAFGRGRIHRGKVLA